ncbi:MAG: flagellin [bacterium]
MALRINHNLAALNAHRNLVNTTNDLSKSMQKLSSGYRINQGSDDPAGLVISEQFRAQIAGLNRAIDNSEGSISMVQTAEGSLAEINSLLISMRDLAIHAANEGFNDADQLAADQAEITNAIKTIDRIAANTQFGTKLLLDGSKANVATITSTNSSDVTLSNSNLNTGSYTLAATKTADPSSVLNTTALGVSLANTDGNPSNLSDGVHNIDVVQASDAAKKTSGSVSIQDAWGNDLTLAAAGRAAYISATGGFSSVGGAANAGTYNFFLNMQENGVLVGTQALSITITASTTSAGVKTKLESAIAANTELAGDVTVTTSVGAIGGVAGSTRFGFQYAKEGAQYSLKTEASTYIGSGTPTFSFASADDRGVSENVLNFTVNDNATGLNTADVTVAAASYATQAALLTAINTGIAVTWNTTTEFAAQTYDTDKIQFATRDEGSSYYIKHNTSVGNDEDLSNVLGLTVDAANSTGTDAIVNFDGYSNTINDIKYAATGTFTLETAAYGDATRGTVNIATEKAAAAFATGIGGVDTGNLLLTVTGTKFDVQLNGGPTTAATAGQDAIVYNGDRTEWITVNYGLTSDGGNETVSRTNQALVFQIGGNVGQTAKISMRNMAASALGTNLTGNMFASLAAIDVTSVQGAQDAQSVIDAAINEVSTTRGSLGSFQKNTLESNLRNLRVAAQNLTASESQLRDTDMAREMSTFTKNQILLQAGTAMLAQANQVPQVVLSLFG